MHEVCIIIVREVFCLITGKVGSILISITSLYIGSIQGKSEVQVSEPISTFRRSGLVLLFPTLCRMWGSDGVVPSLDGAFRLRAIG